MSKELRDAFFTAICQELKDVRVRLTRVRGTDNIAKIEMTIAYAERRIDSIIRLIEQEEEHYLSA